MPVHRPFLLAGSLLSNNTIAGVRAPWDGRLITHVSRAGPDEAARAGVAAARAFAETRCLPARRRASVLRRLADRLAAQREEYVALLRDEAGKPTRYASLEVEQALDVLELCAIAAERQEGPTVDRSFDQGSPQVLRRCFPRGPVLALAAFDLPLLDVVNRLGPAVATGCPIVVRPAEQTPSVALLLGEALVAAGWPAEAVSVLPCDARVADHLVADSAFATVCLSGSPRGGWHVRARAGRKHVAWDAGEEANAILEADADLDRAVPALCEGAFAHAGQHRAGVQRVLVHASLWDTARARIVEEAASVRCGDPARVDVVCGPLVDWSRSTHVEGWIAQAEERGLTLLGGGQRVGSVVTPAVFEATDPRWKARAAEACGPLLVLERYRTLDEAIARVNQGPTNQETGLFTRGMARLWQAFDRVEAGALVHDAYPGLRPTAASASSPRRRGRHEAAMEEMTEVRTLVLRPTAPHLASLERAEVQTIPSL